MKIVRVTTFLDFGGVEKQLELYSKRFLEEYGDNLTIVVLGYGGRIADELKRIGVEVIILDQAVKIPNLNLIHKLYKIFNAKNPDVVHCAAAEANFHGLIAARLARVPLRIGEEIGFPNHNKMWRIVFYLTYLCAKRLICISNSVANKLVELKEVSPSKIDVVYNPVEIDGLPLRAFDSNKQNSFTFITVCRLVPVKNLGALLIAFAALVKQLGRENFLLQIVGDGPEKQALLDLCERLEISDRVSFIGYKSSVIPFLIRADAFVQPSFSEGFSIALVEAMLCGLPSIVTEVGGPSEIVSEGITGFLIDPYDAKKLCEVMKFVFKMPQHERSAMGARARKDALERFSVDKYIKNLSDVYRLH